MAAQEHEAFKSPKSDDVEVDDSASLLYDVHQALQRHASNDVFAVGGAIKLKEAITIRWDSGEEHKGCVVSLPPKDDGVSQRAFQQLLNDYQPATFGRGSEEVLDPEYRNAAKMDPVDFCTDLDLAEYRIMYTLNQALVQSKHVENKNSILNGVVAQLYSLNVLINVPFDMFRLTAATDILGTSGKVQTTCRYSSLRKPDGLSCDLSSLLSSR